MLQGKGVWAYRIGELARAIHIAPEMGATHILYKVGQGAVYYSDRAQAAQEIAAAGLVPFAWSYLLLDNPRGAADVVVRAFEDGYQGFVFDTEGELCRNRFREAVELGQMLRTAGVDPAKLYNCSFPNISYHRSLPYDEMNEYCKGGLMPMSYGTYFAPDSVVPPDQQAERVIDEWTYGHYEYWVRRWGYAPPLYPVLGPYHDEYGRVKMSAAEFQLWLDRLQARGPSFISVFTAAVIADELLPLIRAFRLGAAATPAPTPTVKVEVVSPEAGYLNVRPIPSTELPAIGRVAHSSVLDALEPEAAVRAKVGQDGQWLRVRIPDGRQGYVAAWFLRLHPVAVQRLTLEVVSPEIGFVNVRPTPSLVLPPVTQLDDGATVEALEEPDTVRAKVGAADQWLHVRTPAQIEGYIAGEYLSLFEGPVTHVVVQSAAGVNVRRSPSAGDAVLWRVGDRTVLEVKEDALGVRDKLGKDQWIRVCTPSLREGYVNGLYLARQRQADRRQPVADSSLPYGECAWLFGFHAAGGTTPADFRYLFEGKRKTGWVLFTEAIGADPNSSGGADFSAWAYGGYGVIVRLNNGYGGAGTLPVQAKYADFARACAAYVQRSRGCHIWIIGNEQNNLREHPGGEQRPLEHITPAMYAEAFNLARRRIKEVQPEAIVVPGAVDPYFGLAWPLTGARYRPLDYFREMLAAIEDLDGICLHTYTHWLDVTLITKPTVFTDPFLQPGTPAEHYYDFQTYRSFAEAIPARWRDRPIYITETNHWVALDHAPQAGERVQLGWLNRNVGWVRAAYQEIQRWNSTPHAQQIHCLLLYRWTGDEWALKDKSAVLEDFRQALDNDYRWRR
jgi:hypothetical protein